ncbi:MAG TPA: hypothetical protein VF659_09295 [Pyrinomonadaceae bacterium]|jgi:tetratricopeptide (TPR) repeat protein
MICPEKCVVKKSLLRPNVRETMALDTRDAEALARCEKARTLEEAGDYTGACLVLGDLWNGVGGRPNVEGLGCEAAAEALLRAGRLSSYLGNARAAEGSQDAAKDLLCEAITMYGRTGDLRKVAEAEHGLGVCYFREGAFDEARIHLKQSVARLQSDDELRLTGIVNLAMVERSDGHHRKAYVLLTGVASMIEASENHSLKARFHNELFLFYKNAGRLRRALSAYVACRFHLEKAENYRYLAYLEGNLGAMYLVAAQYAEAHEHLRRAEDLFISLGQRNEASRALETRARVFIAEEQYEAAERTAREAVVLTEAGDDTALLFENLITLGRALARLWRWDDSLSTFIRARAVALEFLGSKKAIEVGNVVTEELLAPVFSEFELPLDDAMLRLEKQVIRNALHTTSDRVTEAAMKLGVTKQNLNYKLKFRHPTLQRGE